MTEIYLTISLSTHSGDDIPQNTVLIIRRSNCISTVSGTVFYTILYYTILYYTILHYTIRLI